MVVGSSRLEAVSLAPPCFIVLIDNLVLIFAYHQLMHAIHPFFFKEISLFKRKLLLAELLWFILGIASILAQVFKNSFNNYLIFRSVFWHLVHQQDLFATYPGEYFDSNHYGPFFGLVIAPFAILPVKLGVFLWGLFNCWILYYAIRQLPLEKNQKTMILWIVLIEQLTALHNQQFNHATAALIILTWVFVDRKKDFWAAFCIIAGIAIKLYGVVGLAFFFMSRRKTVFFLSCLFWTAVIFLLPMAVSSYGFIVDSYQAWYQSLLEKNRLNISAVTTKQDISVGGMFKRLSGNYAFNDMLIMIVAAVTLLAEMIFAIISNTGKAWLLLLASLLLGIVLFSSSSESATYVIALAGAGLFYVLSIEEHPVTTTFLTILTVIMTSICSTDLVPHAIKSRFIIGYSLKALPCFLVWLFIAWQYIAGSLKSRTGRSLQ